MNDFGFERLEEQREEYLSNQDIWETGDIVKICGIKTTIIDCVNYKAPFGHTFVLTVECSHSTELEREK